LLLEHSFYPIFPYTFITYLVRFFSQTAIALQHLPILANFNCQRQLQSNLKMNLFGPTILPMLPGLPFLIITLLPLCWL